ncbi:IPT/TIG domain-containing protein [Proteiniphilum sp. X52]|uniref:IPT/TIG domain-containing protein n=1 Tax=Proteiniphilum sp. X52 TaxID=2382159 RepID=UPI000F0A1B4B|nr:IPT/TIG domain-containing protein [Proteiniphilum sp. X52]RNC63610.1 phospholipase [Proteiniphilum sp. X52]
MLKEIKKNSQRGFIAILLAIALAATSCSLDGGYQGAKPVIPTDPSKPVTFTDFSPKEGPVRTLVFIEGSNFGTDVSKIEVIIGGVSAPVIGSSGTKICAMAPRRSNRGDVIVRIMDEGGKVVKEHQFEELFTLQSALQVNTLTGKVDPQTNASSIINGSFEEAEFQNPWWLEFDIDEEGNKIIYCIDAENLAALRKINLTAREVSTVFMKGQAGVHQVKSMLFDTPTRDTLFLVDDNGRGNWNDRHQMPNMFYALRNESFRKVYPYLYAQCSYSAVSMHDGTIFYNTWTSSEVYKAKQVWDETAQMWDGKALFSVKANSSDHVFMFRHPEDLYVYMTGFNGVYRCAYDKTTKELVSSVLHVGDIGGGSGYADAPGTSARFNRPRQGVFVKNKEYVAQGKADLYDFYVCDHNNNCIRKVTPEGEVSTFAGRGSVGIDGQVWGWIDGEARETARFREPTGICYDEEEEVFYVADRENKRIRTISVE